MDQRPLIGVDKPRIEGDSRRTQSALTMTCYVSYCRVSTSRQGRSGLGLEAQRQAIHAFFSSSEDAVLQPEFVEIESGRRSERPQLNAALALCRRTGATLLIAKLDRLARNVAFVSSLMESGVEFVAVDLPQANRLTIHILAAFAEHEAKLISERTKMALAAASRRGVKLGGNRGYKPPAPPDPSMATAARKRKADHAAFALLPVVNKMRQDGATTLNELARRLNIAGHKTPSTRTTLAKGQWTATSVKRLLERTQQELV